MQSIQPTNDPDLRTRWALRSSAALLIVGGGLFIAGLAIAPQPNCGSCSA